MRGRNRLILIAMALVCVVALGAVVLTAGDGTRSLTPDRKLSPSLRQLSLVYKQFQAQKLSCIELPAELPVRAAAAGGEARSADMLLRKLLAVDELTLGSNAPAASAKGRRGVDRLVDPVLQKRWGDPAFDVGRGFITATSDPRGLESSVLKIRKSWQKDGAWKAFCEFAIFKAEEIAAKAQVSYLSLMPVPETQNDLGSASTGAPRLRVGTAGDWDGGKGYTGQGVIVGDVDTGVDWAHGDFLNPDGTSRILYLWDTSVTTAGKTPQDLFAMTGFNFGTVWTKQEIDDGLCTEFDPSSGGGHGTHTLGTAAGNGGATGNYTGMAPNADIVFVKQLDPMGVEFVFEMARRLGRPAVVNNSWGTSWKQYGPFFGYVDWFPGDGSDENSQYFDWLNSQYPEGNIIVKSAGNNGMWQTYTDHSGAYWWSMYDGSLHFGGRTTQATPISHVYHRIPHGSYGMFYEYSDMMIRSNVPVRVQVTLAEGTVCTMDTGTWGTIPGAHAITSFTEYDLDLGQDPYNGEYMGYMWFDSYYKYYGWPQFAPGDWTIQVTPLNAGATADYDVWLYSSRPYCGNSSCSSGYNAFDSCYTTHSSHDEYQLDWAASRDVITTGAWTTRNEWLGADGAWHYPWTPYNIEPWMNTVTYFSSPGPSRDGRMKPDIAAPGAIIMSARPSNLAIANANLDPDLQHQWMWGTSMAAPHTTGATALLLQKYPGAGTNNVRRLLGSWARNDAHTAEIGPDGFGAGKLNILPLNEPPVAAVSVDKPELVLENHEKATFDGSASYDQEEFKLNYTWSLVAQPSGASATLSPAGKTAVLNPDPVAQGIYQVGLVVNDGIYASEMAVAAVEVRSFAVQPPANAALQRLENDFIFYKEYVNKLTWAANPENHVALAGYKVYRKAKGAADSAYALLATLAPTATVYEDKGLAAAALYTYRITALDVNGHESDPVVVSN